MSDQPGDQRLRFAAIIRLMLTAGASDDVVENFSVLYRNEISGQPQTPIIEVGSAMDRAASEAAARAVATVMTAFGITAPAAAAVGEHPVPLAPRPAPRKAAEPALIYSLSVKGRKTSVSLPPQLYQKAVETLGKRETDKLIVSLAESAPKDSPNRSSFIRSNLSKAITKTAVTHKAPPSVQ